MHLTLVLKALPNQCIDRQAIVTAEYSVNNFQNHEGWKLLKLTAVTAVMIHVAGMSAAGDWFKSETVDRMTDRVTTIYSLSAVAPVDCGFGSTVPRISLACTPEARIAIEVPQCVQSDGFHDWRIDGAKSDTTAIDFQSGGTFGFLQDIEAYLADNVASPRWLGRILTGQSLLISIKPYSGARQIAEFDISGLSGFGPELAGCALLPEGSVLPQPVPDSGAKLDGREPGSLEALVISALACHDTPKPGPVLAKLEALVKLDDSDVTGGDGIGCFEMKGGVDILGMSFDTICAFDDDEEALATYSRYFSRGPGTSPGTRLELVPSDASKDEIETWYRENIRSKPNRGVLTDIYYYSTRGGQFTEMAKAGVGCTTWKADD